ncbi:MAG TPA: NeuD/PglB/VioB family sugar acetyltransferase [Ramlibacter sp.]|nr:NeuD/PglB/VioB family sugar acetyltransferase [Ramlibacter sp.]
MASLLILGAGGHGRVVADAALASRVWSSVSACDRNPAHSAGELLPGVPLHPIESALASAAPVHIAIGNAASREREANAIRADLVATVIHPAATVSSHATVAAGCFIAAQAVVAPGASLGRCVIVNHGAVIDHDVKVGDFSHIAPLVALGGGSQVGSRTLVGSGASVLPGVRVGDDVVIGAGAVVRDHLDQPGIYAGVPARRMK